MTFQKDPRNCFAVSVSNDSPTADKSIPKIAYKVNMSNPLNGLDWNQIMPRMKKSKSNAKVIAKMHIAIDWLPNWRKEPPTKGIQANSAHHGIQTP